MHSFDFMYIIALDALMYTKYVGYTLLMTAPQKEHEERIADARNSLAEVINKARYLQEPTHLTNRGKRVAVVVSTGFYEQATREHVAIERVRSEWPDVYAELFGDLPG